MTIFDTISTFFSSTRPLPPTVNQILADRIAVKRRYPNTQPIRWRGTPSSLDTPTASLYRLYEFFVADWTTQLRNELEYFNRQHTWAVHNIPDPNDADFVRYAILAQLTKLMCVAFNRRIEMGLPRDTPAIIMDFDELAARPKVYEEVPQWALNVRPAGRAGEWVCIPDAEGNIPQEGDDKLSKEFREVGILVKKPHIHFA